MIARRGFLGTILAAAAAPAIVRASSLMPIYVPKPRLLYTGELGVLNGGFRFIESPMLMNGGRLWQDAAGTIPVTRVGQPVGLAEHVGMFDGRWHAAVQPTASKRPTFGLNEQGQAYLAFSEIYPDIMQMR